MIELVAAMTIMLIGVLAVFTLFQAGIVQLRRASTVTTAGALADAEMERFRAGRYDTLGLDESLEDPRSVALGNEPVRIGGWAFRGLFNLPGSTRARSPRLSPQRTQTCTRQTRPTLRTRRRQR